MYEKNEQFENVTFKIRNKSTKFDFYLNGVKANARFDTLNFLPCVDIFTLSNKTYSVLFYYNFIKFITFKLSII